MAHGDSDEADGNGNNGAEKDGDECPKNSDEPARESDTDASSSGGAGNDINKVGPSNSDVFNRAV